MKHILLLTSVLFAALTYAQPVITSQNFYQPNMPVIAFDALSAGINDGTDGPNQIWDFTHLQASAPSEIWGGEAIIPSDVQSNASYGESNLAIQLPSGKLRFWKNTENSLVTYGHDNGGDILELQDGATLLQFPFTYGSTFSDESNGNQTSSCRNYTWETSAEVTGVGYGTLLLPTGTFHNVLKIRRISFSVRKNEEFNLERENYITEHFWFSENHCGPLLYMRIWNNNGCPGSNEGAEVSFASPSITTSTNHVLLQPLDFSLFPNPADDVAFLRIDSDKSVSISLFITDLLGHEVPNQNLKIEVKGTQIIALDISELSSGIYLINLTSDSGSDTKKLIVN